MKLIIEDEEGRKTVVPFAHEDISIGRQDGNTVRLDERNVSRRHALLLRQNGSVLIEDLNSFNGVRVNGDRIQGRAKVQEGDLIQIGDYDLALERERETEPPNRRTEPDLSPVRAPAYDLSPAASSESTPPDGDKLSRHHHTAIIKSPFAAAIIEASSQVAKARRALSVGEKPRLVLLNTQRPGREFLLEQSEVTLGRDGGQADLAIDHRSVSKRHAKLTLGDDGTWLLSDLQSANGIKVNGESYDNAPLRSGDVMTLGHVELRFVAPGDRFSLGEVGALQTQRHRKLQIGALALGGVAVLGLGFWLLRPRATPEVAPEVAERQIATPTRQQPTLAPVPTQAAPVASAVTGAPEPKAPPVVTVPGVRAPAKAPALGEKGVQAVAEGRALAKAHQWEQAGERLKDAEALDAQDPSVQRLRHDIEAGREREAARSAAKPERKKKQLADVASAAPGDEAPATSGKTDHKAKAQAAYGEAITAIGNGDFLSALGKLQRAAELDPTLADAQKGMGICYAHLKEPDKGAYHYEQYLKLKPQARDAPDVQRMLRDYYKSRGGE